MREGVPLVCQFLYDFVQGESRRCPAPWHISRCSGKSMLSSVSSVSAYTTLCKEKAVKQRNSQLWRTGGYVATVGPHIPTVPQSSTWHVSFFRHMIRCLRLCARGKQAMSRLGPWHISRCSVQFHQSQLIRLCARRKQSNQRNSQLWRTGGYVATVGPHIPTVPQSSTWHVSFFRHMLRCLRLCARGKQAMSRPLAHKSMFSSVSLVSAYTTLCKFSFISLYDFVQLFSSVSSAYTTLCKFSFISLYDFLQLFSSVSSAYTTLCKFSFISLYDFVQLFSSVSSVSAYMTTCKEKTVKEGNSQLWRTGGYVATVVHIFRLFHKVPRSMSAFLGVRCLTNFNVSVDRLCVIICVCLWFFLLNGHFPFSPFCIIQPPADLFANYKPIWSVYVTCVSVKCVCDVCL
jgi:hypothetical protein